MGNFIQVIVQQGDCKTTCPLINQSLSKIRELHGGFKSICDNFAMNLTEFETIFTHTEKTFAFWDTDNNGLIDALELFSGLIIFADSKSEEKLRFLFDLFDFNEIQSLSVMDLEFCIQCTVVSASKMYGIGIDINELEGQVSIIVRTSFPEGIRITLPQVLKWSAMTEEVRLFFQVFRMDGPELHSAKQIQESDLILFEKFQEQKIEERAEFPPKGKESQDIVKFRGLRAHQLTQNKRAINFRAWLHTAMQPLIAYRLESKTVTNYLRVPEEVKGKLEWVYGIRCADTQHALQYAVGRQAADSTGQRDSYQKQTQLINEEVVYFIAAVVVLLNPHIGKQRYYVGHPHEVISCCVSNLDGSMIATGELCPDNPEVHVWNCKTLECKAVLKGIHSRGVHLIAFTRDDKRLVTCGLNQRSAIIIYEWESGEVVLSTAINSPTQEIFMLPEFPQNKQDKDDFAQRYGMTSLFNDKTKKKKATQIEGVVVISLHEIYVFTVSDRAFEKHFISLSSAKNYCTAKPLCGMAIVADHHNHYFGYLDTEASGKRHLFLTGHEDGKVLLWRIDGFISPLVDYRDAVTALSKCFEGVAIGTMRGNIYIWDTCLQHHIRQVELAKLPYKILSNHIVAIDFNQRRLMVLTIAGDAIEVTLSSGDNHGGGGANVGPGKVKSRRIPSICKINGRMKAMSLLNQVEKTILIAGDDGIVTSYDMQTHEVVDVWSVGSPVTAMATLSLEEGGFVVAVCTSTGNMVIRQDWEELVPRDHYCGHAAIHDVKFSNNGHYIAVASADKHIYLFEYAENDYHQLAASRLENGVPIALNFDEKSEKLVICTNQRKLMLLCPRTYQLLYKAEEMQQSFWSTWNGRYTLVSKSSSSALLPIALGFTSNLVAAGDEHGNVHLWKDAENLKENIGINMAGHTSPVQRLELTKEDSRIVSLGAFDEALLQWKIDTIDPIYTNAETLHPGEDKQNKEAAELFSKIELTDDSLINELNYCYSEKQIENEVRSDNGVLIRGCNKREVNKMLSKYHAEFEEALWKRPPGISLKLDHIYGCQTSDRRHTAFYMHFTNENTQQSAQPAATEKPQTVTQALGLVGQNNARLDQILPKLLGPNYKQIMDPADKIQYEQVHTSCQKFLVYFTSRFAIMHDANQKKQKFYSGHKLKISTLVRHPFRRVVATGEVNKEPTIHLWDAATLETICVLQTSHGNGVLHLAFSAGGDKLISIGMDRTYSIQVFQWEQERTLAFRNLGYFPVFAVKFDPYNQAQFVTCGYEHIAVWKLKGSHLTCVTMQKFYSQKMGKPGNEEEDYAEEVPRKKLRSVLLCIDFMSYRLGHTIQSDVLFGTSQGEITTYCSGKHFTLNENAHSSSINVIRVTDQVMHGTLNIITGGEDGLIKVWDIAAQLIQKFDIRQAKVIQNFKNPRAYGIQSLDFYCCDKVKSRRMLVGVRCGEIFEAIIEDQDNMQVENEMMARLNKGANHNVFQNKQPLKIDFMTHVSSHSSLYMQSTQKKIAVAVYPTEPIIASVGDDETLRLWDMEKKALICSKNLGTQATCLQFSPESSFLVIGLINGVVLVLDAAIKKLNHGTFIQTYDLPTLEPVMSPKEAKAGVVCIKFSFRGDYLAVSFNNEYKPDNQDDQMEVMKDKSKRKGGGMMTANQQSDTGMGNSSYQRRNDTKDFKDREPAFVLVYLNRVSLLNPGKKLNSKEPYIVHYKIIPPINDVQPNAYMRSLMAVSFMDFSEENKYLEMCVQKVSPDGVKESEKTEDNIYIVWNITDNKLVSDIQDLKNVFWPEWSMANAIHARQHGTHIQLEDQIEERELMFAERQFMTSVARFSLFDNAICGSTTGGLYLFRFSGLVIEKLKEMEFNYEDVRKKDMAATRCYNAHTSAINSIEQYCDRNVISTSLSDQCIVQWKVEYEDQHWELDFNNIMSDNIQDPFAELPSQAKFDKLRNEIWTQRQDVADIAQTVDKDEMREAACEMRLKYVIGRRAFDRRNNIKIDCRKRITYQAGSLVIFLTDNEDALAAQKASSQNATLVNDPNKEANIKQEFLRPEGAKFTTTGASPEMSNFTYSADGRILFVASAQLQAQIFVWEVTTNMLLGKMSVAHVPIILYIKVAHDNKHILCVGLTKEYYQVIVMLDWTTQKLLCIRQMLHSLPFKIKDIDFCPGSTRNFVTCGIQHMTFWHLSGNNLESSHGQLAIAKNLVNRGSSVLSHNQQYQGKFGMKIVADEHQLESYNEAPKDDDYVNIFVTFLAVKFVRDTLISCGDDGYLYLWDRQEIIWRVAAHDGSIFALDVAPKQGLVASGSIEGMVTLWRLAVEDKSNIKSLERLKMFNMRRNVDPKEAVKNPEFNIQSVCIGYNRIVVGMRTGSIYQVMISEDSKIIKPEHDHKRDPIRQWLKCTDHELPKSVGIDMVSQRIFTLTSRGVFSVWDLKTFDITYSKDFQKSAKFLRAFRHTNKVMLVFEREICVINSDDKLGTFDELVDYRLMINTITFAMLNHNEKLLGVATTSASTPEVTLYQTDNGFIKLKQIFGFKSSIKYLDFSTDNFYLLCEDNVGEVTLYEIETDRPIQSEAIDFELEWLGEGLRTYSKLKGVRHQFSTNNDIAQIRKVLGKPIVIVCDEIGTVRLFNYPNVKGDAYYNYYPEHLYQVTECLISPDRNFFVSTCDVDKCIFQWELRYNESKVQKMIENMQNQDK